MQLPPERGMVFTQRGNGWMSRAVRLGERVLGDPGYWSHTGIVGFDGWIWESHILTGVAYRPFPGGVEGLIAAAYRGSVAFWRPAVWTRLSGHDFARAFAAVRAQWRKAYDLRWIFTLGREQDDDKFICSELSGLYLHELCKPYGGWGGDSVKVLTPDDVAKFLERW